MNKSNHFYFLAKLQINTKSQEVVGLGMTAQDMASLTDVFELFDENSRTQKAQYILQFIWRDLTSDYDIIGPYFPSDSSLDHRFILRAVTKSIILFEQFGFKVSGVAHFKKKSY